MRFRASVWLLAMALCGARLQGQAAAPPGPGDVFVAGPVYTSVDGQQGPAFPEVDVVVRDPAGRVPQAADLQLVANDGATSTATSVRRFNDTGYGIEAIMAIDASGSMRGSPLAILRESLFRFVSEARPQDKVGVLSFADDTRWDVPFDASRETLRASLQKLTARGHLTRLNDALLEAIGDFDEGPKRRELIVISDGHDEGSRHSLEEVIAAAQQRKIPVDAIGLTQSSPAYLRNLQRLSQQTGGHFQQAHSDSELQKMVGNSIASLKAQPVARFAVEGISRDGREHQVQIRWTSADASAEAMLPVLAKADLRQRMLDLSPPGRALYFLVPGLLLLLGLGLWLVTGLRRRTPQQPAPAARPQALRPLPGVASAPLVRTGSHSATESERGPEASAGWRQTPKAKDEPPAAAAYASKPRLERTGIVNFFERRPDGVVGFLQILEGPRAGQRVAVDSVRFCIGALPESQLVMADDPTVSGRHACLHFEDRIWMVEDAGSTNGTFVNGQRCQGRRPLSPGDELRMGRSVFRVARA